MPEQVNNTITNSVMEQITEKKIPQTTRGYFLLRKVVAIVGLSVSLLVLVFCISLVVFRLKVSGAWFLFIDGRERFLIGLGMVPWLLVVSIVLVALCAELILRRFGFGYRRPVLYTGAALLVVVMGVGYVVTQTPLHRSMYNKVNGPVPAPWFGTLYPKAHMIAPKYVFLGLVHDLDADGFFLRTRGAADVRVVVTADTQLPVERPVGEEDFVLVVGSQENTVVVARGIRFVPDELRGAGRLLQRR